MKINFKKPKYVLPLIILPFACLFFYVFKSSAKEKIIVEEQVGLQENVSEVSGDIKNAGVTNKLEAYRNQFKESDRLTAIENIQVEPNLDPNSGMMDYDQAYKQMLESNKNEDSYTPIDRSGKQEDEALVNALNVLSGGGSANRQPEQPLHRRQDYQSESSPDEQVDLDPMEVFKQQMAFVDSMSKVNDPDYQAEIEREKRIEKAEKELAEKPRLMVEKANKTAAAFNTIKAEEEESFIKAIVDENIKGYAGSRIRLRLLEDVKVGGHFVKRGTYVYAEIVSFTGQRVGLSIQSIIKDNKIFPVKLDVYDLDGMAGLYVPSSQFREFSKELGGSSLQGMNIQSGVQNQNEFIMSAAERMFTSTSAAIAKVIRKNKAKLKYNTFIYLINPKELEELQKTY